MRSDYIDILNSEWQNHLKPKDNEAPTVISLFAGVGGSSLGYSMAGFKELLAVEYNDKAADILKLNYPDLPVYCDDIANLSIDKIQSITGLKKGELTVLDGSPPCQGFSLSGKRKLDDKRNQLFREYVRILNGLKPRAFVMENVAGMVRGKMRLAFAEILKELKSCGYNVKCWLMNAMYFKVPQYRRRVIFIGIRNDLGMAPQPIAPEAQPISVLEAIGNMPMGRPGNHKQELLNTWFSLKPGISMRKLNPHIDVQECYKLNPFRPSPTILTGRPHWHWRLPRRANIEELSVLTGFPPQFKWQGSQEAQLRGIGNCVPPMFMRGIAKNVLNMIGWL